MRGINMVCVARTTIFLLCIDCNLNAIATNSMKNNNVVSTVNTLHILQVKTVALTKIKYHGNSSPIH